MGTTFKPTLFPHGTLMYLFDGIRELRGVVYRIKSRGPRTEPLGMPHKEVYN